ncbi:MAG: EamA family transporter, partial [Desulfobacterales bacterium]|nr:EamA family transporter [Desulfobacterales bacterium]
TLGKVAVEHSSPVFFGFFYPLVLTIILTPAIIYKGQLRQAFSRPATFIPIGALTAIMIITHFVAISMTDVAYMISVKRTSLLFSVLYGHFLFGEEDITQRLLGSSIMVMGVILITLSQGFSL